MKTLSFDTYSFMPYGNLQSKNIYIYICSLNDSLNVSTNIFSLLGKHFPKTHQLHKLLNCNNVKVSYSSLPNFKSVINGHNKDILNEQEKPSLRNCRDKTSPR